MEVAFVYGTVHQFVLTTEATLLKDAGYVQTLLALLLVSQIVMSNLGLASLLAHVGEKSLSLEVNLLA